jgi:cyclic-di-AMP phosphodiesterase PgpH
MTIHETNSPIKRKVFLFLLLIISLFLILIALIMPILRSYLTPALEAGQVAAQNYRATRAITFESQVLTEQRKQTAAQSVSPIYTSPNTSIARKQLEQLRTSLAYITSVRADVYATTAQKMDDLAAMDDIDLSQESAATILSFSDTRWQAIQQEAIEVLETVMSGTIRPDNINSAIQRVPSLVSLSLSEDQAAIVVELTEAFIAPNSEFSESATEAARIEAMEAVTPVSRSFVAGQTIVSQGEVLSDSDIEALQQLGLAQPEQRWQDIVSTVIVALILVVFLIFYTYQRKRFLLRNPRRLTILSFIFSLFLLSARLAIPTHVVIPYAFPLAAFSLVVSILFGVELALIWSIPLAILTSFGLSNASDLTFYYLISGLFGILAIGRAQRILVFFWAGAAIATAGILSILIYRLPSPSIDPIGILTLFGAASFNGLASASIAILLQLLLAQLLGMTTPIQLMDLTRPDNPLLQLLLREAPGTYQHSLQVSNLAEQAAEQIGADPLLTRVGALYHDIGKSSNPIFFIENQPPDFLNPHDDLKPLDSAQIIIRHVSEGEKLAQKYRLPKRIQDFITEHHGTLITRYQYVQAVKATNSNESEVNIQDFRYPGPRPQSRETAILMLADGCEARIRAERPETEKDLEFLIKNTIENRMSEGQLDDTQLTLSDLTEIRESFTAALRGIYHPRVKYPQLESPTTIDVITQPAPRISKEVKAQITDNIQSSQSD